MFKMGCSMARKILGPGASSSSNGQDSQPFDENATSASGKQQKNKVLASSADGNNSGAGGKPKSGDELGDFSKLEQDPRLPLNVRQIFKITKSWKAIARTMSKTGTAMFLNLFEQNQDLFYLFDRFQHLKGRDLYESMELREHAATVMATLDQSINSLSDYDNFVSYLHSIGQLHRKVPGFKREYFWRIEQPFMKAIKQTLDERCNETIEQIYKIAVKLIIETIADGYGQDADGDKSRGASAGGDAGARGSGGGGGGQSGESERGDTNRAESRDQDKGNGGGGSGGGKIEPAKSAGSSESGGKRARGESGEAKSAGGARNLSPLDERGSRKNSRCGPIFGQTAHREAQANAPTPQAPSRRTLSSSSSSLDTPTTNTTISTNNSNNSNNNNKTMASLLAATRALVGELDDGQPLDAHHAQEWRRLLAGSGPLINNGAHSGELVVGLRDDEHDEQVEDDKSTASVCNGRRGGADSAGQGAPATTIKIKETSEASDNLINIDEMAELERAHIDTDHDQDHDRDYQHDHQCGGRRQHSEQGVAESGAELSKNKLAHLDRQVVDARDAGINLLRAVECAQVTVHSSTISPVGVLAAVPVNGSIIHSHRRELKLSGRQGLGALAATSDCDSDKLVGAAGLTPPPTPADTQASLPRLHRRRLVTTARGDATKRDVAAAVAPNNRPASPAYVSTRAQASNNSNNDHDSSSSSINDGNTNRNSDNQDGAQVTRRRSRPPAAEAAHRVELRRVALEVAREQSGGQLTPGLVRLLLLINRLSLALGQRDQVDPKSELIASRPPSLTVC